MRLVCGTPARVNHVDTILYEIYVLRGCWSPYDP